MTSVDLESGTTVNGNICALNGNVILRSTNTRVTGDINASGDVILQWSTVVTGNIFAGGNVEIAGNAIVNGDVHAGSISGSGSGNVEGAFTGEDVERILPSFCITEPILSPRIQTFTADPGNNITVSNCRFCS